MNLKLTFRICLFGILLVIFSSCRTYTPVYDYKKLAKASLKLRMDIDPADNHKLYIEAAEWIGVPYRAGGNTKRGTDCSGFTTHIYKKVYNKKISRSSEEQRTKDCRRISKRNLKEGDLVFFSSQKRKKKATHAGIYLKNGKFVHASTSRGVMISSLDEPYYKQHWMCGGRTGN